MTLTKSHKRIGKPYEENMAKVGIMSQPNQQKEDNFVKFYFGLQTILSKKILEKPVCLFRGIPIQKISKFPIVHVPTASLVSEHILFSL